MLVFALLTIVFLIAGCTFDIRQAPKPVRSAFDSMFPGATHVEWEKVMSTYKAEFYHEGREKEVQFDSDGTWQRTKTELSFFDSIVYLAEEAWNIAVMYNSLDDACDTAYNTHDPDEAGIITTMIQYKKEQYPQDKVLIRDIETQRDENGELTYSFDFDYSVMDDGLDAFEAANDDDFDLDDWLDQKAIDKALEGIPPEFQKAAYDHEVNRQINEMKKRFDDLLKAEKDGESSPES